MINLHCRDISKAHVSKVFEQAFGYPLAVNPRTYSGPCVCKANINGTHTGKIVHCPIAEVEADKVYQKLVDARYDAKHFREMRIPIIGKKIPFLYFKYKKLESRFGVSKFGEIVEADQALSKEELHQIFQFCKLLGMDFGELDVCRDRNDGRIYVVDANNTPTLNFSGFSWRDELRAIEMLGQAFDKTFFHSLGRH